MTLRMGDGPPGNIPAGLDAVAGYVNKSGIGITFPQIAAAFPAAEHLSITTDGSPAMCADVETGAMSTWSGYPYGYAQVSRVGDLIRQNGRPKKLWAAHYTEVPHICTSAQCWPASPVSWAADGTQWTTHNNTWDESLLADDFFALTPTSHPPTEEDMFLAAHPTAQGYWIAKPDGSVFAFEAAKYHGGGNALPGGAKMASPCCGIAPTPTGLGYWLVDTEGHIYAFGDALWHGNAT